MGKYYGNVGDNIGCYVHLHRRWYTARHLDGKIKSRSSSNNTDPRCNADDPQLRLFNTSGDASGHWKSARFNCGLYLCSSTDCALDQPRIRLVDEEVLEAADSFGANYKQRLFGIQIPLALPNIFAGVNQTIMMALAMVVIASMIGVRGLGVPVLQAVSNQYLALGLMNGLAIVAIAIIFDRVSQKYGERLQSYRKGHNND